MDLKEFATPLANIFTGIILLLLAIFIIHLPNTEGVIGGVALTCLFCGPMFGLGGAAQLRVLDKEPKDKKPQDTPAETPPSE